MWQAKASELNIPLPAKGHAVCQRGAFTRLAIDTHKRSFHMLQKKLASMVSARDDLAAVALSTRIIARVHGKVFHYGCVIPFVAVAALSLSQLMHNREAGTGPVAVPSLEEEKEAEFDWDRELRVSERAYGPWSSYVRPWRSTATSGSPSGLWCRASSMGHSWRARSAMLASWLSHSTPSCTAGRRSCARPRMSPVLRLWVATRPQWTCSARHSSARQRCRTAGGAAAQVYWETLPGFLATQAAS
jgi:hypothetical protein